MAQSSDEVQLVTFRLGGVEFAFNIFQVERVLRHQVPERLPMAIGSSIWPRRQRFSQKAGHTRPQIMANGLASRPLWPRKPASWWWSWSKGGLGWWLMR